MTHKTPWILLGILIITIPGTVSDDPEVTGPLTSEVTYSRQSICALKGESVELTCSYTPPGNQTVLSISWFSPKQSGQWWSREQPEDLLLDPDYAGRVTHNWTGDRSSTLTIIDLRLTDSGFYRCLFTSHQGTLSDSTGVNVTVTDLQMKVEETTPVELSCSTLCSLDFKMLKISSKDVKYLYFNINKNGQFFNHTYFSKPALHLSKADEGSYSCAVGGLDNLPSPAVCVLSDRCWSVSYSETRVCALRGSSVVLLSSYTYPRGHTEVKSTLWYIRWREGEHPTDLCSLEEFKGRVKHLRNIQDRSKLEIQNVTETDAGEYKFRFTTTASYFGKPGIILNVTGLQVRVSADNVSEGQRVTLTCSTTCTLSNNPIYIWYKNGNPISLTHTTRSNRLYLMAVSREEGGNYSCAVKGHVHLTSPAVTLHGYHFGPDKQPQRSVVFATVGIIILLAMLVLCLILWIRRKRRSNSFNSQNIETTGGNRQANPRSVCYSASAQGGDKEDENDVQYSSIQFRQPNQPSSNQQHTPRDDSDVLYAAVKVPPT